MRKIYALTLVLFLYAGHSHARLPDCPSSGYFDNCFGTSLEPMDISMLVGGRTMLTNVSREFNTFWSSTMDALRSSPQKLEFWEWAIIEGEWLDMRPLISFKNPVANGVIRRLSCSSPGNQIGYQADGKGPKGKDLKWNGFLSCAESYFETSLACGE